MIFTVTEARAPQNAPPETAYLIVDNFNDWFTYRTMFTLVVVDSAGEHHQPGSVKIGQRGMRGWKHIENGVAGQGAPELPQTFEVLSDQFFSLGQDDTYYETLNRLPDALKIRVLAGLRDIAFDLDLFEAVREEDVLGQSLLRYIPESNVRGRFNRLTRGDAVLTEFHFTYTLPAVGDDIPPALTFDVHPSVQPPTNVHVLIGRNGVGKTRLMQGIAYALLGREVEDNSVGTMVVAAEAFDDVQNFAGLVLVSFSAFDDFDLDSSPADPLKAVQVGLRTEIKTDAGPVAATKSPPQLGQDFVASMEKCRIGLRAERWRNAVETLGQDDLFADANVASLLDWPEDGWRAEAARLFKLLSSGHKIILLTITKLVEHLDERTLVLLDEPEAHLHPPLLAAFVRSLSDLLGSRNGVAIIATHSPVVLQEVPKSCVWKIRRNGSHTRADRPEAETFAENVSDLTREVFNLEITKTGFHQLIAMAVERADRSYDDVVSLFDGQLGAEGRALARALVSERNQEEL